MTVEKDRRIHGDGTSHTARDIINAYQLLVEFSSLAIPLLMIWIASKPKNGGQVEVKDAVDFFGRTIVAKPKTAEEEGELFPLASNSE